MAEIKYYVRYILWKTNTPPLKTVSEVLWILISGWGLFITYVLATVPLFTSIIGIVFVPKVIQIAIFSFDPIGWEIVPNVYPTSSIHDPNNMFVRLMNILWFIFLGWEFFIMHVVFAVVQALTIVGLGNAIRHIQIATATIFPFGKHIQRTPLPIKPSRSPPQQQALSINPPFVNRAAGNFASLPVYYPPQPVQRPLPPIPN